MDIILIAITSLVDVKSADVTGYRETGRVGGRREQRGKKDQLKQGGDGYVGRRKAIGEGKYGNGEAAWW